MKRLVLFALCSSVLLSSCYYFTGKKIRGNGHVVAESRNFSGFTGLDVSSAIHLYVKLDSSYSVKVETDDNLQGYVMISDDNGTLHIRQENNTRLDPTGSIKVYVSAPAFKNLEASGACRIIGENVISSGDEIYVHVSGASDAKFELKAPKLFADMSGASNISLAGETKDLIIKGSGASHARCFDLLAENADVDISGASKAEVFASVKLNGEASGASDIRYKGTPSVSQNVSGAGSMKKVD